QGAALELRAVERGDRRLGAVRHFHEAEAPAAAGLAVGHDLGLLHRAVLAEQGLEVRGRGLERQVADIDVLRHQSPSAGMECPAAHPNKLWPQSAARKADTNGGVPDRRAWGCARGET